MRVPNQLRVPLRRSRTLALAIVGVAVLATGSWLAIDAPWWSKAAVASVVTGWTIAALRQHALRIARSSVVEVLLSDDAVVVVRTRGDRLVAGHVREASFVHPWLTTIVWRPDGARFSRSLAIVPDMLDVDDFRRLRVLLRYGRREVTADAPASHA